MPDADRHTYEEDIRRGGFVLTADVDDDTLPWGSRDTTYGEGRFRSYVPRD